MQYLFYHLYILIKKNSINSIPWFSAIILLTLIQFANLTSALLILNQFVHVNLKLIPLKSQLFYFCIAGTLLLIFNYLFVNKKFEGISERFNKKGKIFNLIGMIVSTLYIVLSILLMYILFKYFPFK
jgi:hypothetical protein